MAGLGSGSGYLRYMLGTIPLRDPPCSSMYLKYLALATTCARFLTHPLNHLRALSEAEHNTTRNRDQRDLLTSPLGQQLGRVEGSSRQSGLIAKVGNTSSDLEWN